MSRIFALAGSFASCSLPCLKSFWVVNDLFGEIDVDIWPVEISAPGLGSGRNDFCRLILESRDFATGHKQLLNIRQHADYTL